MRNVCSRIIYQGSAQEFDMRIYLDAVGGAFASETERVSICDPFNGLQRTYSLFGLLPYLARRHHVRILPLCLSILYSGAFSGSVAEAIVAGSSGSGRS